MTPICELLDALRERGLLDRVTSVTVGDSTVALASMRPEVPAAEPEDPEKIARRRAAQEDAMLYASADD